MSATFPRTPYDKLATATGGWRVLLSEKRGDAYSGMQYIGTVLNPSFDLKSEKAQTYNSATGSETLYREAVTGNTLSVKFKGNEMFAQNMRRLFFGNDVEHVPENLAATAGPDLVIAGLSGEVHGLDYGRQTDVQKDALTVHNVTDSVDLVAETDYTVIRQYGLTFIKMLVDTHQGDTLRIGTSTTASTAYEYKSLAKDVVAPMTKTSIEVKGVLQGPSKNGPNFELRFETALLTGSGLSLDPKKFTEFDFELAFQDNSANDPNYPFGRLELTGYDSDGAATV